MSDLDRQQAEMRERMKLLAEQQKPVALPPIGRHYRTVDLARTLRMSLRTVRRLFEDEPGVIKIGHEAGFRIRRHIALFIPEYVVMRVYDRLKKNIVQISPAKRSPRKKTQKGPCGQKAKVVRRPRLPAST